MKLRLLLLPFSVFYICVTALRNKLFDWHILPSKKYQTPIISVGNITVGGTGKTPLSEYLIQLLSNESYQLALLSRGYKRATKGALLATEQSTVSQIGDEPFQLLTKFPKLTVAVAEKRVEGMELLLKNTTTNLVLLDDAFQHRYLTPGLSILVIDYNRPMWNDFPFPAGNLREMAVGRKRAQLIVVNKCPITLTTSEKEYWLKKLKPLSNQSVFFTTITYGEPKPLLADVCETMPTEHTSIIGLAGIAQPSLFKHHLTNNYRLTTFLEFPDHHNFTPNDLSNLNELFSRDGGKQRIITTEKDAVRLAALEKLPFQLKKHIFYIPIQLNVLFDEGILFDEKILDYAKHNTSNY